jgi:hypothetical protein
VRNKKAFYLDFLLQFVDPDDRILRADADEFHQYETDIYDITKICEEK